MRYLTLAADYGTFSLVDSFDDYFDLEKLGLSRELLNKLRIWNDDYQWVVPLTFDERQVPAVAARIIDLDQEGVRLALQIQSECPSKIKYFSEGLLRSIEL